jgi:5-methylcytosine-specific restriction endonuclease McrA
MRRYVARRSAKRLKFLGKISKKRFLTFYRIMKGEDIMAKPFWQNFSDDELREIVATSISFREAQIRLGYSSNSGSITERLKTVFDKKQIDYSHFKGHAWNKRSAPITEMNDFGVLNKASIKAILLQERPYQCECCGISSWLNKSITLEVHHKDGNSNHNVRDNLMLLCPNCHSQTENWCHKNVKSSTRISDEEFLEALNNANSICDACRQLGITPNQSSYNRARKLLNKEAK